MSACNIQNCPTVRIQTQLNGLFLFLHFCVSLDEPSSTNTEVCSQQHGYRSIPVAHSGSNCVGQAVYGRLLRVPPLS